MALPKEEAVLALPPPYTELVLREGGDAFARALAEAESGAGAGLLVWVRRYDSVDCAVVLEPEEDLATARQVIFAGQVAVADALSAISPPEKPLTLVWPDAIRFDGGLVGGARLGWPADCAEAATPDFLVFGFALRTDLSRDHGAVPPAALITEGFDDFESGPFVESFARHFMLVLDEWSHRGVQAVMRRWQGYGGVPLTGDLAQALRRPSWLAEGEIAA
jgi:hypothetical protein